VSGEVKDAEHDAVVCVLRSACERVTEREEFVGRFSLESRFPQYLQDVSNGRWTRSCAWRVSRT